MLPATGSGKCLRPPASFREASEFDFFRGQPGRKDRPDIHDDGRLAEEPIRKMKGFTDVGCTMLTRERWGAAKFIQGQFRVFVCNDYERTEWVEANQNTRTGVVFYMDHKDFLEIIRPVFPKECESPHLMAVLKRANIVVNAGRILIFRRATQEEITAPYMCTAMPVDYLKPQSAARYMDYRDQKVEKVVPHSSFAEHVAWEARYIDALLTGKNLPLPRAQVNNASLRRLFQGEPDPTSFSPRSLPSAASTLPTSEAAFPAPKAIAVKGEPRPFQRALSGLSCGPIIDLDTPPKKAAKTAPSSVDIKTESLEASNVTEATSAPPVPAEHATGSAALDESSPAPGSPMDVATPDGSVHDPMEDLSQEPGLTQELERIMDSEYGIE